MNAKDEPVTTGARENVPEYNKLSEPSRRAVRATVRQAGAHGISEAQTATMARVASRSGLNIVFDAKAALGEDGAIAGNTIYLNPEANPARLERTLLLHEAAHAVFKEKGGKKFIAKAIKNVDIDKASEIEQKYRAKYEELGLRFEEYSPLVEEEIVAAHLEEVLGDADAWEYILKESPSADDGLISFFKAAARDYASHQGLSREARTLLREYKKLFESFASHNVGNNAISLTANGQKTAPSNSQTFVNLKADKQFARGEKTKITIGMTDSERAEILRDRIVVAPIYEGQADAEIIKEKTRLEKEKKKFGKEAVVNIANNLGIVNETINFDDVGVEIIISNGNIKESITKEASPEQMAKLLPILKETAKNAVAIERHSNRYYHDSDTIFFDNLLGGYLDGGNFIPTRFGLKYSRMGNTTLYVIVNQNEISVNNLTEIKEDRGHSDTSPDLTESKSHLRSVNYSIAQIFSLVNSKDLLRYVPNDFLNDGQINTKLEAIRDTEKYTDKKNDEHYSTYIGKSKATAAKQMLSAKAKQEGYYVDSNTGDLRKPGDENSKTTEITYDDDGRLIPISKRYDSANPDKRFALSNKTAQKAVQGDPDKVVVSKAGLQKRRAELTSDRVYSKKEIVEAVRGVEGFKQVPDDVSRDFINEVWKTLNSLDSAKKREAYLEKAGKQLAHLIKVKALPADKSVLLRIYEDARCSLMEPL